MHSGSASPWRTVGRAAAAGLALIFVGLLAPAAIGQPLPDIVDPGPDAPVSVTSNVLTYDSTRTTVVASGNVVITYGAYVLKADQVSYNPRSQRITADGNVVLTEPDGAVLTAHRLVLSDRFQRGFIERVGVLLVNNARINARRAERVNRNITTFTDVTYTACEPCKEDPSRPVTWKIKADRITHRRDERVLEYENVRFNFLGVPVAYVPRFSHADPTVKRKSGFLIPTLEVSDELGAGVEVPYFFNLAPNYDFTFSPLITSKQGPVLKGRWRHRLANGVYSITPTAVYQFSRDPETPGNSRFRGSIASRGDFRLAQYWNWGWDGTYVSDDTYLRRYNIDNTTDITSQVYLTGLRDRNYFDARAYHFRGLLATDNNDGTPYVLPIVDHHYYFDRPVLGGEFKVDTNFLNLARTEGTDATRFVTEMEWQRRMVTRPGVVVTPFAHVRGDLYWVDNVVAPGPPATVQDRETVARLLPAAGIDVRWPFVNLTAHGEHVIEPVAQLIVRPNETDLDDLPNEDSRSFTFDETNLFSINKFSGLDRWEGGTRANVGFNYTYRYSPMGHFKAVIGQSYQIAGRNSFAVGSGLSEDDSDFVGGFFLQINPNLLFTSRLRLDNETLDIRRNEIGVNARYGRVQIAVNYADLDKAPLFSRPRHQEEIWTQGSLRLSDTWTVYGGVRYNIEDDQRISDFAGVGYEDECFAFRLNYSETFVRDRDVDPERALSLRFELKTIGSTGFSTGIN